MPTDPYVASRLDDQPSQDPNLGARVPPAESWKLGRPGDFNGPQPEGTLLGRPGPNVGYAMSLAEKIGPSLQTAPHEARADACAVVAEVAMKRAAAFGRGPVLADLQMAATLLGYMGTTDAEFTQWRAHATHGADHHYLERRQVVDAVPDDVLRTAPSRLTDALLHDARAQIRAAFAHH
ncbi:MAG: hypothetical protein ACOYNI_11325 [Acidimicrobiia bacterium]